MVAEVDLYFLVFLFYFIWALPEGSIPDSAIVPPFTPAPQIGIWESRWTQALLSRSKHALWPTKHCPNVSCWGWGYYLLWLAFLCNRTTCLVSSGLHLLCEASLIHCDSQVPSAPGDTLHANIKWSACHFLGMSLAETVFLFFHF